jgi:hypothetical protein
LNSLSSKNSTIKIISTNLNWIRYFFLWIRRVFLKFADKFEFVEYDIISLNSLLFNFLISSNSN